MSKENINPKISLIKKTLGKDGKYYYYESLSPLENIDEVYWYRIDKSYFDFILLNQQNNAINIEKNDSGEIIQMEYISKPVNPQKNNKGCSKAVILFLSAIMLFYKLAI